MKIIDLYIVVNNVDPYGGSRVRAYPYNKQNINGQSATDLLAYDDGVNSYIPWGKSDKFETDNDPYCFEPFLPKHINLIPSQGDLIKVISYDSEPNHPKEYIVVNSTVENIGKETYNQAKRFHVNDNTRIETNNPNITPGYNPSIDDVGLLSGKNSALLLNNNRVMIKSGYQKQLDGNEKTTNPHRAIINLINFESGYTISENEEDVPIQSRVKIFSVLEYRVYDKTENPITIDDKTYPIALEFLFTKLGTPKFVENLTDTSITPELSLLIYLEDTKDINNIVSSIIQRFDNKDLGLEIDGEYHNGPISNFLYTVLDKRSPIGGVTPNQSINTGLRYYIRNSQEQSLTKQNGKILSIIDTTIRTSNGQVRPSTPQSGNTEKKTVRKFKSNNKPEANIIHAADNHYFLTHGDHTYTQLNIDEYYTKDTLYNKGGLLDTTEPIVRGNQLLSLVSMLVDLILNHGHQDNSESRFTIDRISNETLNNIKSSIKSIKKDEKNLSLSDNDINSVIMKLINHHIRIN